MCDIEKEINKELKDRNIDPKKAKDEWSLISGNIILWGGQYLGINRKTYKKRKNGTYNTKKIVDHIDLIMQRKKKFADDRIRERLLVEERREVLERLFPEHVTLYHATVGPLRFYVRSKGFEVCGMVSEDQMVAIADVIKNEKTKTDQLLLPLGETS